jgi:hypothetical protein
MSAFCLSCREEDLREAPRRAACVRCDAPACPQHDRCYGCGRVVCIACDTVPSPAFAFPGDRWQHPHSPELVPVA